MAGPGCRLLQLARVTLALTGGCAAVTGKHFPGVNKEPVARGEETLMSTASSVSAEVIFCLGIRMVVFLLELCFHVDCSL